MLTLSGSGRLRTDGIYLLKPLKMKMTFYALLAGLFFPFLFAGKSNAQVSFLPPSTVVEMKDNYDGLLRNHKKTDALLIDADVLMNILKDCQGQKVSIVFARYINGEVVNGKKNRSTLLLKVYAADKKTVQYIDLGKTGNLCPEPQNCD